ERADRRPHLLGERSDGALVEIGDDDLGAFLGEKPRGGAAHAGAAARDDRHLPAETRHRFSALGPGQIAFATARFVLLHCSSISGAASRILAFISAVSVG